VVWSQRVEQTHRIEARLRNECGSELSCRGGVELCSNDADYDALSDYLDDEYYY